MSFVHRERVRFGDLDAMRHLNNVVFLRYFETARIAYLGELIGHHPMKPPEDAVEFIFAEAHVNYRSPVHFDEEMTIALSVSDIRRSSFRINFRMTVDERLAAEGYGVLVGFDYGAQQARPIPDRVRGRLEEEEAGRGS